MSEDRLLRVVIADDEPLARQRLEDLLAREENVEIVARAANGREAVDAIRGSEPDLVFLDVQMPGMSGIDVASAIGPESMPATIFVTAYDQHALKAFELAAIDYLVKPFDDDRFHQALRRARTVVELRQVEQATRKLMALLGTSGGAAPVAAKEPAAAPEYLERISVTSRGQVRVVPVEKIDYITASGPYAELHAGEKTYVIRERMQTLEERLDPARFARIHRSGIVRIDRVDALLRRPGGEYAVRLKDGNELSVSRTRRDELAEKLGME